MIKQLSKHDTVISPFKAVKAWELFNIYNETSILLEPISGGVDIVNTTVVLDYIDYNNGSPYSNYDCNIALEQQPEDLALFEDGISGSGKFNPDTDPRNSTGTYKNLLYTQIYRAFYNQYKNPVEIFGMENIDFPLSKTNRYLADNFRLITVPQSMFGDKLSEGSIQFFDNNLDDNVNIYDDKLGNLLAGKNLFSKIQEIRHLGNIIMSGTTFNDCTICTTLQTWDNIESNTWDNLYFPTWDMMKDITADFIGIPLTGASPLTVTFTNTSINGITYLWDFGDGNTSTEENPVHTYASGGNYTVTLITYNCEYSNTKVKTDYINIVYADFTATPTSGYFPLAVTFTNTSINALSYLWDFGDGSTSAVVNPSHTYNIPGAYTITLVAYNGIYSGTKTSVNYIVVSSVTSDFTATPTSGYFPLAVTFTNTSINATSYLWDFGDGSTSAVANPSHTYASGGNYTVTLISYNGAYFDTEVKSNYIAVSIPVTADFSGTPTSGNYPLAVTFTNTSTNALTYNWDFGDGGTSTSTSPSHTYTIAGNYTVTLVSHNGIYSDTEIKSNYIAVSTPIIVTANFTGTPLSGDYPLAVTFTNTSINGITYDWDFGDGSSHSTLTNPSHTYAAPGAYTVVLVANNGIYSNTKTRTNYIAVSSPIVVTSDFTGTPTSGDYPLSVTMTNTSVNGIYYYWDFGDGNFSYLMNPVPTYNAPGTYTVTLTAQNGIYSDIKTRTNYITVGSVHANFTGTPLAGGVPLAVTFTNTSINATSYLWNFGDGTTSTSTSPSHTYNAIGIYTVTMTAYRGIYSDTMIKTNYINANLQANFSATPTQGKFPLLVTFTNLSTNGVTYDWDFGDGGTSTDENPTHTYNASGYYTVTLVAHNGAYSSTKTIINYIIIYHVVADFTASPTSGTHPLTVNFTNTSWNAGRYVWYFDEGGGPGSTATNPSHTFLYARTYNVQLQAFNGVIVDVLDVPITVT